MTLTDVILLLLLLLFLGICKRENVWGPYHAQKWPPRHHWNASAVMCHEYSVVIVDNTLLRNRPPVGCSGVLHSEEFLALSLLLLGSLSLMMSYWRQKRAITPVRRGRVRLLWHRNPLCDGTLVHFPLCVLTCPHNEDHNDDDELPCPQLGGLAHFLHCHFIWRSQHNVIQNTLTLLKCPFHGNIIEI